MIKTETITLKTIDEFDAESKKKIIDKNRYINVEGSSWADFDVEQLKEMLSEKGFESTELWYDISYCQGSGASFDCNFFNLNKLLEPCNVKHKRWIRDIIENYCEPEIYRNSYATHYCHRKTRRFELNQALELDKCKRISKILSEIENDIEILRQELCDEIYKSLESTFEYLTSDESVEETLMINEIYF